MSFLSIQFVVFVIATFIIFASLRPAHRCLVLLLASYIFYASWSLPFIAVLLATTSVDYFCSLFIHRTNNQARKKLALVVGISVNLAVLMFFKYFNFFIDSANSFRHILGIAGSTSHLAILLPIGISFYTFEAISYLVDVYRGAQPAPNWLAYNFYIMWFPHLIAGPIVRFNRFFPQYATGIAMPSPEKLSRAARLMILGYFCKSVVAGLASQLAQQLWAHPDRATVLQTQVGIIAFALEIFADYYGYISIARGVSLLFNIDLPQNFRMPIAARNLADFWRRWNITLSLWLHDYLFLPLGGSRRSWLRTVTNVLITFAVAGLWHGASWNFVIMGIFFGLIVSVYHMYRRVRSKLLGNFEQAVVNLPAYTFVSWMLTLGSIFLGAVFFRSEHVADAFTIIGRCFQFGTAACELKTCLQTGDLTILIAFLFCVICFSLEYLLRQPYELMRVRLPVWAQAQAATLVLLLCWVCSADLPQQFWYARF